MNNIYMSTNMKINFGAIIITVLLRTALSGQCCNSTFVTIISKGMCSDGTNLTLDCHKTDKYMLTPEDNFIDDNENLYIISDGGNVTIVQNRFCTGFTEESMKKVAIVCFDAEDEYNSYMKIYSICLLVSDLFLVLTLIVYIAFPILRDLQGKSVMSFTACLCLGYFLLATMQLEYFGHSPSPTFCKVIGFTLYYLFMSAFFWLSIISFNIWRSATWQVSWSDAQLGLFYNVIGYGCSGIFLIAAILAHHTPGNHIKPDFSLTCWFSDKSETWAYFYGPIGVLLSCNIAFFTLTVIRLWQDYKDSSPGARIKVLRFKCQLYLKLFLTMGISWIFEILSYMFDPNEWYITDIVNSLQGVIIFIVMVATRKRVLRLVASTGFCIPCLNKNWQTIKDEESENDVQSEQIQLS